MDDGTLLSIGDLARRTGLTVKTVRFYSDRGIVVPAGRSAAGYRLYGARALARLELVRTLRELGLDLATIRGVVDRELTLPEVAAAHAEALAAQIRVLRLRRGVLLAVAEHGSTPEEMDRMHRLAQLTGEERRRVIDGFLDAVLGGLADPAVAGIRRTLTPELPDDPAPEQLRAWVELAGLAQDETFRARLRALAEELTARRARGGEGLPRRDLVAVVRDRVGPALTAGVDPASARAVPVVAALTAGCAEALGTADDDALRGRLPSLLAAADDPRRERYVALLATVNGWPAPESAAPALDWSLRALAAHSAGRTGPAGGGVTSEGAVAPTRHRAG
ncbi:MerR family transcriptional regulator [Streptomyces sp. NPDC058691]|uniref:MerR family transcriptional regulator n=1 Tax=Streptomyces sp. NPDC058691 TaxID=3346601 RepID=UPI0036634659